MRAFHFPSLLLALCLAACTSRSTGDHVAPDLGGGADLGTTGDAGGDGAASDAPAADAPSGDAMADAHVVDMGPPDIGGEACGSSVCITGVSYCCAASCNLCLPNAMFCRTDPCAGVDAGPHDAGPPPPDLGAPMRCGSTTCSPGTVCMSCATPFGITMSCLPPGMPCRPVPVP